MHYIALLPHQVHLYAAELDKYSGAELADFFKLLSDDEKTRAQRFHFAKDRNHFTATRGLLRTLISKYLATNPQAIQFNYNTHGKPELAENYHLQFNVSHSYGMALFGFTLEKAIGVDIEFMDPKCDIDAIAERYFSTNEYQIIKNLSGEKKLQAFFNGWSRKEAFLKALGAGLSYPLKQVEVSVAPDEPTKFTALHDENLNIADWQLYSLEIKEKFKAALAVQGKVENISIN